MFGQSTETKWKTKYLETLDELDQKEKTWSRLEEVLRRAVARLAIAADDSDPRLGPALKDIRQSVATTVKEKHLLASLDEVDRVLKSTPVMTQSKAQVLEGLREELTPAPSQPSASVHGGDIKPLEPALIGLLDRLSECAAIEEGTASVREQLNQGVDREHWEEVLEELADVITGALETFTEQRRQIEEVFEHVAEQLAHFQSYVEVSRGDVEKSHSNRETLEREVSSQVEDIRSEVHKSTNIDELKTRIETRLTTISQQLAGFTKRENVRLNEVSDHNEALEQKISDLEFETEALKERCQKQRTRLMLDPLTQVHSRYAYNHRVDEEFGRWLRYGQPLSFAIWDVDHFKSINDTFGHKAGDRALTKLAQLVRSNLRDSDFLARVGGEEFVVLMPGLGAEQSSQAIEKLIGTIETAGFNYQGKRVPITISSGVTEFRSGDKPDIVYGRADRALYDAKSGGRNCMVQA